MMSCICKKDMDGLKTSHRSISLAKINSFHLGESLSHESCFIPHNNAIFILFVLEDPLGADNIAAILWFLYELPNFVAFEVISFFMHCNNPIGVFKSIKNLLRFNHGNVSLMITEACKFSYSGY